MPDEPSNNEPPLGLKLMWQLNLPQASCQKPPKLHMVISAGALGKMASIQSKAPRNKHCNPASSHEDARLQQLGFDPEKRQRNTQQQPFLEVFLLLSAFFLEDFFSAAASARGYMTPCAKGKLRTVHANTAKCRMSHQIIEAPLGLKLMWHAQLASGKLPKATNTAMVISAGALGKMESLQAKAPRNKHCNLAPSQEDARLQQPDFAQP
eukprot:CAMPEP_0183599610 /NCGR_PEP_ID=MMETSP0371-20130417/179521_1 /TAXON_ID=268820 /ORGANISM="Peridinium aciculiferum, Strain PAER-2" /LENGTH=208 /DNA_ID=CAMNT_0025811679 /DNA_START=221 /DNA_END=849 /DNA_ORIENTATION=-